MLYFLFHTLSACTNASHHYSMFFSAAPAHPPPHPFPTRRSSDLRSSLHAAEVTDLLRDKSAPVKFQPGHCCLPVRRGRSEEHTSELQSRFDLVCRLLLEIKNNL